MAGEPFQNVQYGFAALSRPFANSEIKFNENELVTLRQLELQFIHYCKMPNMTTFFEGETVLKCL